MKKLNLILAFTSVVLFASVALAEDPLFDADIHDPEMARAADAGTGVIPTWDAILDADFLDPEMARAADAGRGVVLAWDPILDADYLGGNCASPSESGSNGHVAGK